MELQKEVVTSFHDSLLAGHPRFFKMLHLIKEHYWWPGMTIFLKKYIDGCAICQQMKPNTHPTVTPLMPIKSHVHWPFQQIMMDFITDLPLSNGFDSIFVVVNQGLSKGVILIPCNKTVTALQTANLLIREVFKWFGLPNKIISDRGPQFTAAAFQEVMKALKIKHSMSTTFHPQTDRQTECLNQELEVYLHIFCANEPHTWNSLLPIAEFTHNQCTHEALKQTPFYLMYGANPVVLPLAVETTAPAATERLRSLNKAREEALATHELAHQKMTQQNMKHTKPFKQGQKVWLESCNLHIPYTSWKLAPKREGPFPIQKVLGPVTYQLQLLKQWKIHNVFHACLLSPYKETEEHRPNHTDPPPDLIDGENEYEVEAILAHRKRGRQIQYLVKWKGYDLSNNTWEPEINLSNADEILSGYKIQRNLDWNHSSLHPHRYTICPPALNNLLQNPPHLPTIPTNPSLLKQSPPSSTMLYKQMTPLQLLYCDPSWLPFQIKPRFENSTLKTWRSMAPTPRPTMSWLKKKIRMTVRVPLCWSASTPCLPLNQPNSLEWFQEWFNILKLYSQVQSTLEEKNSRVYQLLTSQHISTDLKICLIDLLYGVIAEFNWQQTIINLYWNYLLQEVTYPTEILPLTSTSLTELPRSITMPGLTSTA